MGDHVWIGQDAFVSKGSCIGSGSIVGAKSVTGGKTIPSNCSSAGMPCKVIRENIFWLKPSVHKYIEEDTKKSMNYNKDTYMYSADGKQIDFKKLEKCLDKCKTSSEMFDVLKEKIFENKDKNRFFIPSENENRSGLRKFFSK